MPKPVRALAFDAYGTLFNVFSVTALSDELFQGHGPALAQHWRVKQLQCSLLRSLMQRHADFWRLTEDALEWAASPGAASAGLTTFWIQRSAAEPAEELGFPAAHVVRSLAELPALI